MIIIWKGNFHLTGGSVEVSSEAFQRSHPRPRGRILTNIRNYKAATYTRINCHPSAGNDATIRREKKSRTSQTMNERRSHWNDFLRETFVQDAHRWFCKDFLLHFPHVESVVIIFLQIPWDHIVRPLSVTHFNVKIIKISFNVWLPAHHWDGRTDSRSRSSSSR